MKTKDAIKHYKTKAAVADVCKVRPQAVAAWGEYPPDDKQAEMHCESKGKIKAEPSVIEKYRRLAEGMK